MALTFTFIDRNTAGKWHEVVYNVLLDSSYATGGYAISASQVQLGRILGATVLGMNAAGSGIVKVDWDYTNNKLMAFRVATFTPTITGDLNLATPAFSGTGLTAAGQVLTTTDTQTMTLNQCAGMWLLAATTTTPPMLIVSNTAVSAAAAVLTVIGAAATDAGAYKIVQSIGPAAQGQVALAQVSNAVSLSAVTVRMRFIGNK